MLAKRRRLPLVLIAVAGLISLAACSSGSSGTGGGGGGGGTPTPSSNGLTVYPQTASVPVGGTVDFTGYVPSNSSATITWAVSGSSNGSITSAGVYTAPASVPSPAQVAVTATSGNFSGTAVLTITSASGVSVGPAAASVAAGATVQFAATENGAAATISKWEVNGTQGGDSVHGTIDGNGNYLAPLTPPPGGSTVITAVASDNSSGTSTATVVFSNASLSGSYAFSYSGDDSSGFLAVAGNFIADANSGTITGTEDVLSLATDPPATTDIAITGTYSIGPDGRGTALIGSTSEQWQFALGSNQHGVMINFGEIGTTGAATGSGTIDQTTIGTPLVAGRYVLQVAGLAFGTDGNLYPADAAGSVSSLGSGSFAASPANTIDINNAGTITSNDTTMTGVYFLPPVAGSPGTIELTSTALTTMTGGTVVFDYYVVSAGHLHLIETDGDAVMAGDLYASPAAPGGGYVASLLQKGSYAFTLGGSTGSPYAAGGVFITDGGTSSTSTSGTITGGVFDNNNGGVHFQKDVSLSSTTYGVDATTGRISSSITTSAGTFDWVGYVTSPVDPSNPESIEVLIIESDNIAVAAGTGYLQAATSQPSGNFALNLTGIGFSGSAGATEQDILAQLGINGTTITGTMDINNFEVNGQFLGLNIATSKSTIASPDSNGRGTATFTAAGGASFPVAYYVVDGNTVVMIELDSQRVMVGTMLKQF
ncbi:MAG TPA: hypothetical protein VMH00_09370 [Candidatus Limnocylindrales bacterium]|nr:hypothetical protein [Candidatus Limnocylindrales bacterium]